MSELGGIFTPWQAGLLFGLQCVAPFFWMLQNREGALGGPISLAKAIWLLYAITLWIVVPCLLWSQHWAFAMLAVSMIIRSAIEVPLCLLVKWKVAYGVAHDFLHLILTGIALTMGILDSNRALIIISGLTIAALFTELIFVRWFRQDTEGPENGVYFVSGAKENEAITVRTILFLAPQISTFAAIIVSDLAVIDFPDVP